MEAPCHPRGDFMSDNPAKSKPPEDRVALLRAIADAYDALAADPDALAEVRAERQLWDITLADGLPAPAGEVDGGPDAGGSVDDRPLPGAGPRAGGDARGRNSRR